MKREGHPLTVARVQMQGCFPAARHEIPLLCQTTIGGGGSICWRRREVGERCGTPTLDSRATDTGSGGVRVRQCQSSNERVIPSSRPDKIRMQTVVGASEKTRTIDTSRASASSTFVLVMLQLSARPNILHHHIRLPRCDQSSQPFCQGYCQLPSCMGGTANHFEAG